MLEAGDAYPSGVVRGLIYKDSFARHGYDVRFVSRLLPPLHRFLAAPPRALSVILASGGGELLRRTERLFLSRREAALVRIARDYDVVYMCKASSFDLIRRLRNETRARLVLDFTDALWLPNRRIEGFDALLGLVDAVTTDNEWTAAYVRPLQPNCTVIPDSPQIEWFDRARATRRRPDDRVVLGWVGTPSTTYNLFAVWEALERVFSRRDNLHLRLVGANPRGLPPFERVTWSNRQGYSQGSMIDEVLGMHVGLFPLQDVEACRVRGVLKASVYMAGGACVVASPVGQNRDFIEHGVTGFLASTVGEWEEVLLRVIDGADERTSVAENAMAMVRSQFTVERAFERLRRVLDPDDAGTRIAPAPGRTDPTL